MSGLRTHRQPGGGNLVSDRADAMPGMRPGDGGDFPGTGIGRR